MASKKELKALITLAGKIDPSLQTALLKASGESMKLSKNLHKSAKGLNQVGTIAKGTFIGSLASRAFTNAVSNFKSFASESIQLASDLKEVQNVVDTTFKSSSKEIDDWAKNAKVNFGLSTLQAKQFTGTLGAMLKSSGVSNEAMVVMSQKLSGLSGDFASFYNLDHEDAFNKIRAGISGETEPLKQLGINMSVANLEAFALSKGIKTSWKDMDQASQTMLRYSYLMEVSNDAQGDFAKTQGEFANQQRLWTTNFKEFSATIASKALPYATKFFQKANNFIMNVDIDKYTEKASKGFEILANSMNWTKENADWLVPSITGVVGAFMGFKILTFITDGLKAYRLAMVSTEAITALSKGSILGLNAAMLVQKATTLHATYVTGGFNAVLAANPIGATVIAIGALIAAGVALWKNWDKVKAKAAELWDSVKKYVEPIGKFFGIGSDSAIKINGKVSYSDHSMSLARYAKGGIATKPSIFGEAGPEIAIPLRKTPRSFELLNVAAQMLGVDLLGKISNLSNYYDGSNAQTSSPRISILDKQIPNTSGSNDKSDSNIQFIYNPTVYGSSRSEIEPLLQRHKEEIKEIIEDIIHGERRVQFES